METNYKETAKQLGKNVAAATAGSALGYFGGGLIGKKLLDSRSVRTKLRSLTPTQRKAMVKKLKTAGNLAAGTAAGLSSIAISDAMRKKKTQEKTAQFFTSYVLRSLL